MGAQSDQQVGEFLGPEEITSHWIEGQPLDRRNILVIPSVENEKLDQVRVAFGNVYGSIRSPFRGKQLSAGTGMMADGIIYGPRPEHDGTNRNAARCSPYRIAHLVHGKNSANTPDWAARPQDNGIRGVKSLKRGG